MGDVLELVDRLWRGEVSIESHHPVTQVGGLTEVGDGIAFVSSFANVSAFDTDDGLVLVDTGSFMLAEPTRARLRGVTKRPVHTAIWTHGHVDHCFGVDLYE